MPLLKIKKVIRTVWFCHRSQYDIARIIVSLIFFITTHTLHAATLKIGVLQSLKPKQIEISSSSAVELYNKGSLLYTVSAGKTISVKAYQNTLQIIVDSASIIGVSTLKILGPTVSSSLKISVGSNPIYKAEYTGYLTIKPVGNELKIVNNVDIDQYVAGVVEAEAGRGNTLEFLKVQSIICRTYALSHIRRHEKEGFQLCDMIHCQVYRGKAKSNTTLIKAVEETKNQVIIDSTKTLITAAFHSNCGGETRNAEDEWNNSVPYLCAINDTFCLKALHAQWTSKISTLSWKEYLQKKDSTLTFDSTFTDSSLNRPYIRGEMFYTFKNLIIPFKTLRSDWKLKSTRFSITHEKDTVTLRGYGYGHGVGMCQEGAIRQSALGFNYKEIINFYYHNVGIIDLEALNLLKEE